MRGLRYRSDEEQCDTQGSQPFRRSRFCDDVHNCPAVRCSIQPNCLNLAGDESYREILALEWLSTGASFAVNVPSSLLTDAIRPVGIVGNLGSGNVLDHSGVVHRPSELRELV
jgi:hypothetical protein